MKLINLNIEGDKHFDTVIPFVEKERPDVLCLQEAFKADLFRFKELGYNTIFRGETLKMRDGVLSEEGNAVCTLHTIQNERVFYYRNAESELRFFDQEDKLKSVHENIGGVLFVDIEISGIIYTVGTTHFTWTPNGAIASAEQSDSMDALLSFTKTLEPHMLTGDFNLSRKQNILYTRLIEHYNDPIPSSYTSSLDATLHYAGSDPEKQHIFTDYMVDYIFTQPPYRARDVRLEFGISDHAAVVAIIERT